ncbi:hypothetical protein QE385_003661 [Sphingomonas sp. SORGH_AS 950]|uniref:hypothetical protein n=1 Tax=Sphingomonas sp. SORGH_AS_0950 TaxID=3041792 RepID=UPI0027864B1B|nr:hypothetical protein [Sphingomonas sp. SORGH_AS_0950]MDQ1159334.1 hypothetical protein [Sphingomonas sp. SORGH_AS_0950]
MTFVVSGRVPGVDWFYDAIRGTTAVPTKTSPAYHPVVRSAGRGGRALQESLSGMWIFWGQDRRSAKLSDRWKPNNRDEESFKIEAGVELRGLLLIRDGIGVCRKPYPSDICGENGRRMCRARYFTKDVGQQESRPV